ncbi:hypothetical protein LX32DRAFT_340748 [Colletotrichum zoysiae]|uniref:Uncharacterized protein n=1 Tax=Colletotrichum zoysiae TaxID=1216348 RepID=A0AAD9M525_9PEZI|nr:hypothetical protein LX32DRAFT_340748 [Colletotrichum zoysiae]
MEQIQQGRRPDQCLGVVERPPSLYLVGSFAQAVQTPSRSAETESGPGAAWGERTGRWGWISTYAAWLGHDPDGRASSRCNIAVRRSRIQYARLWGDHISLASGQRAGAGGRAAREKPAKRLEPTRPKGPALSLITSSSSILFFSHLPRKRGVTMGGGGLLPPCQNRRLDALRTQPESRTHITILGIYSAGLIPISESGRYELERLAIAGWSVVHVVPKRHDFANLKP